MESIERVCFKMIRFRKRLDCSMSEEAGRPGLQLGVGGGLTGMVVVEIKSMVSASILG